MTVNLSNNIFDQSTYTLLERGLSYVPRPPNLRVPDFIEGQNSLIRSLKLNSLSNKPNNSLIVTDKASKKVPKKFVEKSNWQPSMHSLTPATIKTIQSIQITTSEKLNLEIKNDLPKNFETGLTLTLGVDQAPTPLFNKCFKNKSKDNLSKMERQSLTKLKNNSEIIIKSADKGGATVIMDRNLYIQEAERQLSNPKYYTKIDQPLGPRNKVKITEILTGILNKKLITPAQFKYLSGPKEFLTRTFYLLPKIHKEKTKWPNPKMPEGRPIVSDCDSESSRVAEYIDSFVNPLAVKNFSYIKNSYEFVSKIRHKACPPGYLIVTGDVKALYTNMNIARIIQVVTDEFKANPDPHRPDLEILQLLELTLYNNDFTFNNQQYLQIHGCAMGKKYSPGLAGLYMKYFDECAVNNFEIKAEYYFRFLDDIHFLWGGGEAKLLEYQKFLNQLIPDIEVTLEYSPVGLPFLDTFVYSFDNKLETKIFFKPTDTHQLLQRDSYHPPHVCKGILKSQLIRFKRISSKYTDYVETCNTLFSFLKNRGYSSSNFRKLKFDIWYNYIPKNNTEPQSVQQPHQAMIPIIMPYNSIGVELIKNYKKIIKADSQFRDYRLVAAYKIAPNLKKMLVRSNLSGTHPSTCEISMGHFFKCDQPRCNACIYSKNARTCRNRVSQKEFSIVKQINCGTKNLIYLITCTRCGLQYVGETGRTLRERLAVHLSTIKLKKNTSIGIHFNLHGHSHRDVLIIGIEGLGLDNERERKLKEKNWIARLHTEYPHGLNFFPVDRPDF